MVPLNPQVIQKLAMDLAAEVHRAHQSGSGSIPLEHLVRITGLPLAASEQEQIRARGDLVLTPTSPDGGTFRNAGAAIEFPTLLATIVVPAEIKGGYRSTPDSLAVEFDPAHTIKATKMKMTAPLERISIDPAGAQVHVGGFLGPLLSQKIAF